MKIQSINISPIKTSSFLSKSKFLDNPVKNTPKLQSFKGLECLSNYNKSNISFTGYYGDGMPAKKLFWMATGRNHIYKDDETDRLAWRVDTSCGQKAWSTMPPRDLLQRNVEQAIQSICTLNNTYEIPDYIGTPNYGDNWGRRANYLEINPRLLAKAEGYELSEGLLNTIKILPAIPPSTKSIPMCVVLSQIFPTYGSYHDGYTGDVGVYCMDLFNGISKSLTSRNIERAGYSMTDEELVKAFNDLAHFRGLKTGVRMPISAGQMSVKGQPFNWHSEYDLNAYINSCCWLIDMGFDSIYFDSGKHIGNWEMENYCGCGEVPEYHTMQYITSEIRKRTGRGDLSFVAEKTNLDPRYENAGYTAGTDWGRADYQDNLWHEYRNQEWNSNYAAGPIISDDNDDGAMSYEQRHTRLRNAFSTFDNPYKKLPVHMQMHDLFPLSEYLNTHGTMMESQNLSTTGDTNSHYYNIFSSSDAAFNQTMNMYREFEKIMDR